MWSPLLKLLERIGGVRTPFIKIRDRMVVGNTQVPDALGTAYWKGFLNARDLSRVWGPHDTGGWKPFHCLTLFIALDYLRQEQVGPCEHDPWPMKQFEMPEWIDSSTLLFVDLQGPKSVALGAALAVGGCDLVCTFNNWPNPRGVIKPEETLAALLRYASLLKEKRTAYPTPAPVAWLCDADRFGAPPGRPGQFDNRYYIEDSIIPGPNYLRERGISKIVYISGPKDASNQMQSRSKTPNAIKDDLGVHLDHFRKDGFQVFTAIASNDGILYELQPYLLAGPSFSKMGFFRSSAGGFGAPVPHPSSSG